MRIRSVILMLLFTLLAVSCGVQREDASAVAAVDAPTEATSDDPEAAAGGLDEADDDALSSGDVVQPTTTIAPAPTSTAPAADVAATLVFGDGSSAELLHGPLNDIVVPTSQNTDFVNLVYGGVVPPAFETLVLSQTVLGEVMNNELAQLGSAASDADLEEATSLLFVQLEQLLAGAPDPTAEAQRLFDEVPYLPFIVNLQASQIALSAALAASSDAAVIEDPCVRHILVDAEETADEVLALLADGGDFATLAAEYSTGPTGPNGGDLGCGPADAYVPEFATAVTEGTVGEFIGPVETQFGFHVILVERLEPRPVDGDLLAQDQLTLGLQSTSVDIDERIGTWDAVQGAVIPAGG